jgi:hypothetical protein
LGGTWKALLGSDDAAAYQDTYDSISYNFDYLTTVTGRLVVSKATIWRSGPTSTSQTLSFLNTPISNDEFGNLLEGVNNVWTGSYEDGSAGSGCNGWITNSALAYGDVGGSKYSDNRWLIGTALPEPETCDNFNHLYCVEQ